MCGSGLLGTGGRGRGQGSDLRQTARQMGLHVPRGCMSIETEEICTAARYYDVMRLSRRSYRPCW
jgi:hypothetical protein